MCLFLDVLSAHARLRPHQQLAQSAFFAGKERHWGGIARARTDGGGNGAIGHVRGLNSDLLLIEINLAGCLTVFWRRVFEQVDALVEVLPHLGFRHFFDLLFVRWSIRSLFKLQQFLVIFADLFSVNDLFAFWFLLNLREHLLSGLQEDLFEILHIALLSFWMQSYLFKGFGLNSEDSFFLPISNFLYLLGTSFSGDFGIGFSSYFAVSSMAVWYLGYNWVGCACWRCCEWDRVRIVRAGIVFICWGSASTCYSIFLPAWESKASPTACSLNFIYDTSNHKQNIWKGIQVYRFESRHLLSLITLFTVIIVK